jgi:hypothetical protein
MNSIRVPFIASIVIALSAVTQAASYEGTMKLSQDTANYSVGSGGAFVASDFTGPLSLDSYSSLAQNLGGTGFLTFCLEKNEYFHPSNWNTPGKTIYNYNLSYGAMNGGVGGQTSANFDPLSNATAWLYSQFAMGNLADLTAAFTYSLTGFGNLQQAIWKLENEISSTSGDVSTLVNLAKAATGAGWNSASNGTYGVKVINLFYQDGTRAQDQIYFVPDEASTAALLGLGLLGLAAFRRRFAGGR